jgi:pyruvate dehydrogenase E2 component (dihydrolipoamide acetyltransferase)
VPTEFKLPELGENVQSGDVLRVLVKSGDTVAADQPVVELETDKATIEVPSSVAGKVAEVKVKAGDKVSVGQVILVVEEGAAPGRDAGSAEAPGEAPATGAPAPAPTEAPAPAASSPAPRSAPEADEAEAQKLDTTPEEPPVAVDEDEASRPSPDRGRGRRGEVVEMTRAARPPAESPAAAPSPPKIAAPAAPSTRRLARELGVDIDSVSGSGPSGRVSADDVKAHARRILSGGVAGLRLGEPLPDFEKWGPIERKPLRAVRRKTAQHLTAAWLSIPHVTQHDRADITGLETARKKYAAEVETAGGALTMTAIAVKVLAAAVRKFPQFNSSIDMQREELIEKQYVNVGVAVDTERGLLVPVIRDADKKSIVDISRELAQLSGRARAGKASLEEMQGGTISISNLGGLGGTAFSPIVNLPEVAILGISRASMQPIFIDEEFQPRLMLPLSLSYDHRVIDGADAVRFLRWIVEALEQPFALTLYA